MSGLRANAAGVTHKGAVRPANEDAMMLHPSGHLWVVADGMGGHADGSWASQEIITSLSRVVMTGAFETDIAAVSDAIHLANSSISSRSAKQHEIIGSTVVALYLAETRFAVFWAGDSRIYLMRSGRLHLLTHDHTQIQELVDAGLLSDSDARDHPSAGVLSRAVGVRPSLELDAISDFAQPGDVFLLCSDGLTGVIAEAGLAARLQQGAAKSAVEQLLDLALAAGAPDNVTIITVACDEKTELGVL